MPFADPDPTDPMTLVGVQVSTADTGAARDMAECFIEEYARLGFDEARLWRLFTNAGFAGPNLALKSLGLAVIRAMIAEQVQCRRRPAMGVAVEWTDRGTIRLPVLQ